MHDFIMLICNAVNCPLLNSYASAIDTNCEERSGWRGDGMPLGSRYKQIFIYNDGIRGLSLFCGIYIK
jgi:hypothetical protein